jgi:hypothetical protein
MLTIKICLNYLHKFCENQAANSNLTLKHFPRNHDRAYFLLSRMTESVGNNENLNGFGTTVM